LPTAPTTPALDVRACNDPNTLVLVLSGRVQLHHVPGLCERARLILNASDARRVVCDVGALGDPDVVTVETLARLRLAARKRDREVVLRDASERLLELLDLVGLGGVLPPCRDSVVEAEGNPE
jgi:anti-anti-sigma regulatory factor